MQFIQGEYPFFKYSKIHAKEPQSHNLSIKLYL